MWFFKKRKWERLVITDISVETSKGLMNGKLIIYIEPRLKKHKSIVVIPGYGKHRVSLEEHTSTSTFRKLNNAIQDAFNKPLNLPCEILDDTLLKFQ